MINGEYKEEDIEKIKELYIKWKSALREKIERSERKESTLDLYFINKRWLEDWFQKFSKQRSTPYTQSELRFKLIDNTLLTKNPDTTEPKIDPEEQFEILNMATWSKIARDEHLEKKLKIEGIFCNEKLMIDLHYKFNFYFYYVDKGTPNINEFYLCLNKISSIPKITSIIDQIKHMGIYDFLKIIKAKNTQATQTLTFLDQQIKFRYKKIAANNPSAKANVAKIQANPKNEPTPSVNNNDRDLLLECLVSYYAFKDNLLKLTEKKNGYIDKKMCLIDKDWLNYFINTYSYKTIKEFLAKKQNFKIDNYHSYKSEILKFYKVNDYLKNDKRPIPKLKMDTIEVSEKDYEFYNSYDVIDKETLEIFIEYFGTECKEEEHKEYLVNILPETNTYIINLSELHAEMVQLSGNAKFIIVATKKTNLFAGIIYYFQQFGFEDGFKKLSIKDRERSVSSIYIDKKEIGLLINIKRKSKDEKFYFGD